MMLKKFAVILLVSLSLVGCSKSEGVKGVIEFFAKIMSGEKNLTGKDQKYNKEQTQLLSEISGIWRSDASQLVSILIEKGQLFFVIDDEPKEAKISEIDTANEIVNLKMIDLYSNEEVIWTIRKTTINEKGDFNLKLISHDGEAYDLSFVRNISETDKNRILKMVANYEKSSELEEDHYQLQSMDDYANTIATEVYDVAVADQRAVDLAEREAAIAVAEAAAQAAVARATVVVEAPVVEKYEPQEKFKTEKLHLYADAQVNNGMLSLTTDRGFVTWSVSVMNSGVANSLRHLGSGQCFSLVSKKGFNQTDGRDIQSAYQVSC